MEKLKISYNSLQKALKTLISSIDTLDKAKKLGDESFILACQDSIIQRFEYSFDSFWKFLKQYLEKIHLIETEGIRSPKSVIRMCVKIKMCTEQEGQILIKMVDARNATSHTYDILEAHTILEYVPSFYNCMKEILDNVKL